MSLAAEARTAFDSRTIQRGNQYHRTGRVVIETYGKDRVAAQVQGSRRRPYAVEIRTAERAGQLLLHTDCSCPHAAGGNLCKHLWATLRMLDELGWPAAQAPGRRRSNGDGTAGGRRDSTKGRTDRRRGSGAAGHGRTRETGPDSGGTGAGGTASVDRRSVRDPRERNEMIGAAPEPSRALVRKQKGRPQSNPATEDSAAQSWRTLVDKMAPGVPARGTDHLWGAEAPGRPRRELWYSIDPLESRSRSRLVIRLYQRELRSNGKLGKRKVLRLTERTRAELLHGEDRQALDLILGCHVGELHDWQSYLGTGIGDGTSYVLVGRVSHASVLPALCRTGRLVVGQSKSRRFHDSWRSWAAIPEPVQPLRWEADPWRLQLQVRPDETSGWCCEARFVRGEEQLEVGRAVRLPDLLLHDGVLAPLDGSGQRWADALRDRPRIQIPQEHLAIFFDAIWQVPNVPEIDLAPEHGWRMIREAPRPRLDISPGTTKHLTARVSFDYGGCCVEEREDRSGMVDPETKTARPRDRSAETTFLTALPRSGVVPDPDRAARPGEWRLLAKEMPRIVRQLTEQEWTVEAAKRRIRHGAAARWSIRSGVDWFDLDGRIDFDGASVRLPALLQAKERAEGWVTLDDGTIGVIPEEWLSRIEPIIRLAEGGNGKLRFRSSQGLLLDALLASEPAVSVDERFQALRERVRGFTGIDALDPPTSFRGKLREYQRHGLGWFRFLRDFGLGGCLADDMGLGKTVQVLAMLEQRRLLARDGDERRPSLAVVPRSLLGNWIEEAARFVPQMKVLDHSGPDRERSPGALLSYDFVVTTYGTLRRDISVLKDVRFDVAVLDEAQAIKTAATQAAKASRLIRAEHRLALTGTPIENHLGELWSLFEFLNPGMLGTHRAFDALGNGGGRIRARADGDPGGTDELFDLLARALRPVLLRRTKEQVLPELPSKTEQTVFCDMPPAQRKMYNELRVHFRNGLTRKIDEVGWKRAKILVLEALLRLRQAACHPGLLDPKHERVSNAKVDVLFEQIHEVVGSGHKALIFSQFTSFLRIIRHRLEEEGLAYAYLDGRTRKRQERVRCFQEDPRCPLFLISLKAGGHGLNLTAADYVFLLDPWWNPAVEAQAIDRVHRIGQRRPVFAYRLVASGTVEEKILELQKRKKALADAVLSQDRGGLRGLTIEDLELLLG